MAIQPITVGFVLGIVVLILSILGMAGVIVAREQILFGLIAVLAVSRLC